MLNFSRIVTHTAECLCTVLLFQLVSELLYLIIVHLKYHPEIILILHLESILLWLDLQDTFKISDCSHKSIFTVHTI